MSSEARRILDERAARLARPIEAGSQDGALDFIILSMGGGRYGIEVRFTLEVVREPILAPIPNAPDIVAGVVNWRGTILPVFDLRRLFGLARDDQPGTTVTVIGDGAAEFGIQSREDVGKVSLHPQEIRADVTATFGIDPSLVRGVTAQAVVILDAAALLKDPRLFVGSTSSTRDERGGST